MSPSQTQVGHCVAWFHVTKQLARLASIQFTELTSAEMPASKDNGLQMTTLNISLVYLGPRWPPAYLCRCLGYDTVIIFTSGIAMGDNLMSICILRQWWVHSEFALAISAWKAIGL